MLKISYKICILAVTLLALLSCGRKVTYEVAIPEYLTFNELRSSVNVYTNDLPDLVNPGKIYLLDDLLFIGERNQGIHVVDISMPSSPEKIAFIALLGNTDISILQKDGETLLYADSFIDLVVFSINPDSSSFSATETYRIEEVFPNDPYQYFSGDGYIPFFEDLNTENQVVIDYTIETYTEWEPFGSYYDTANSGAEGTAGTAGSMARFILHGDEFDSWYLYTIDSRNLQIFDLDTPSTPMPDSTKSIGWDIETLFPYKDMLYIGSSSAMYVYSLEAASNPTLLAQVEHFTSRDPVVVGPVGPNSTDTAFVTLRAENGWGVNQLIAFNVEDPVNPVELLTLDMWNPHGLGLREDRLFLCEGTAGIKAFDVSNLYQSSLADTERINKLAQNVEIETYDIIVLENLQLVIGSDGLYLYNLDESLDPAEFVEEGSIAVMQ